MKNPLLFRICLLLICIGIVVTLLPVAFPKSQTESIIGGSDVPTNVVMTSNNRYMELSLEGTNFTADLKILRLSINGSAILIDEFVYDAPSVISIDPGVYVIQVRLERSIEPIRLLVKQFGTSLRYFYIGVPIALIGLVLIILDFVHRKIE
jgi:hypothetical protein